MSYADFLQTKERRAHRVGAIPTDIHSFLHDWQREVVQWACGVGRAAIWADTGLGKTVMQLEWARHMAGPGGRALVVAPLAVCHQTSREARNRIDLHTEYTRDGDRLGPGVWITNYEMLPHFNPHDFNAVVLDEASILKSSDGKTRTALIEWASAVPYRLSCTATPAPNDPEELTNQAEFLGQMSRVHMLAGYYVHDDTGWRLKGHAHRPMLEWMATWAIALRTPSDIGGQDDGYILPGLEIKSTLVPVAVDSGDQLFATELGGVQGRAAIRKQTLDARVQAAADIINAEPGEPWLIWCGLNAEADAIAKATGATNVHGALTPEQKADALLAFADGAIQRLVTKPAIASQGLNYQHCARMIFVGLSDSYEQYYQAIRRCYRYGQTRVVEAHIVLSEIEGQIANNVARKEREAAHITDGLVSEMRRARGLQENAS